MAALLRVPSISLAGAVGEMRANDVQLAWRGSSGSMVVLDLASVTSVEWVQGCLHIVHNSNEGSSNTLTLEGFAPDLHESICALFKHHAQVFLVGEPEAAKGLPTLLTSASPAVNCGGAVIKPQLEPEKAETSELNRASVQQEEVVPERDEGKRGAMVQRRIANDDDEGMSCLFNEDFAPKVSDERTHPYFLSARNAAYGRSLFEGFVWKRSAWMKKWERRYMVLSTTGLFSYKERSNMLPSVVFDKVVACYIAEEAGKKGFCVVAREGLIAKKHFIAADNDAARDQWVTKINVALLRCQQ